MSAQTQESPAPSAIDEAAQHGAAIDKLTEIGERLSKAYDGFSSAFLAVGIVLAEGSAHLDTFPALKVRFIDWATAHVDEPEQTIYRMRAAGAVASVLGDKSEGASLTSLVPLYKILTSKKIADEDKSAAIVKVWDRAVASKTGATAKSVEGALKRAYPKVVGSRGPEASPSSGDTPRSGGAPSREVDIATPDAAAIEGAVAFIGSTIRTSEKALSGSRDLVLSVMAATIRACSERGVTTMQGALDSLASGSAAADAVTEDTPAEDAVPA